MPLHNKEKTYQKKYGLNTYVIYVVWVFNRMVKSRGKQSIDFDVTQRLRLP